MLNNLTDDQRSAIEMAIRNIAIYQWSQTYRHMYHIITGVWYDAKTFNTIEELKIVYADPGHIMRQPDYLTRQLQMLLTLMDMIGGLE